MDDVNQINYIQGSRDQYETERENNYNPREKIMTNTNIQVQRN